MRRRKAGAGSMATTNCPSSFKKSGSPTGSKSPPTRRPRNPKPPPPEPSGPSPKFGDSSDQLWSDVKARQLNVRHVLTHDDAGVRSERARRPAYLLLTCFDAAT